LKEEEVHGLVKEIHGLAKEVHVLVEEGHHLKEEDLLVKVEVIHVKDLEDLKDGINLHKDSDQLKEEVLNNGELNLGELDQLGKVNLGELDHGIKDLDLNLGEKLLNHGISLLLELLPT
jgi:hypothetical protein